MRRMTTRVRRIVPGPFSTPRAGPGGDLGYTLSATGRGGSSPQPVASRGCSRGLRRPGSWREEGGAQRSDPPTPFVSADSGVPLVKGARPSGVLFQTSPSGLSDAATGPSLAGACLVRGHMMSASRNRREGTVHSASCRIACVAAVVVAGCSSRESSAELQGGSVDQRTFTPTKYSVEDFYKNSAFAGASWSPDRQKLLVSSNMSGIWNAYAVPAGGGS